jgi:hypothetical protein
VGHRPRRRGHSPRNSRPRSHRLPL